MAVWAKYEDELIIADYFQMLNSELKGLHYNKTTHRNKLLSLLKNRNASSIEFKHRNISAVLIKCGMPYINGYKPLFRYQQLLEDEVLAYLNSLKGIEKVFDDFASKEITKPPKLIDFKKWNVPPPAASIGKKSASRTFTPVKRNYLEIEQKNQSIGKLGEKLVYEYEIWRLHKADLPRLADKVKWVSKDLGDGAGYDILSKDNKGSDIYIEVKSTKLGKESPIFFSDNECDFSKEKSSSFFLYRVFDLKVEPKIFIKNGTFSDICSVVEPTKFKGYF